MWIFADALQAKFERMQRTPLLVAEALVQLSDAMTAEGARGMLTMPGDIPLLTSAEITGVLDAHERSRGFTIVPAGDKKGSNAVACSLASGPAYDRPKVTQAVGRKAGMWGARRTSDALGQFAARDAQLALHHAQHHKQYQGVIPECNRY